jgi:hypothetical protein
VRTGRQQQADDSLRADLHAGLPQWSGAVLERQIRVRSACEQQGDDLFVFLQNRLKQWRAEALGSAVGVRAVPEEELSHLNTSHSGGDG